MPAAPLFAVLLACPPCVAVPPPPLAVEAVTLGSRPDRLAAYADRLPVVYPHGVPTDEAAVALDLLRADRAASLGLSPAPLGPPGPLPGPVAFGPYGATAPPAVRGFDATSAVPRRSPVPRRPRAGRELGRELFIPAADTPGAGRVRP